VVEAEPILSYGPKPRKWAQSYQTETNITKSKMCWADQSQAQGKFLQELARD